MLKFCLRAVIALPAIALAWFVLAPAPARANCYELFGCTNSDYYKVSQLTQASCQILWEMCNQIYKENGYCLHTPKAIDAFGNAGCVHDDMADVPLNDAGQHNVSAINGAEAAKRLLGAREGYASFQ